jgi:hypothetical protein
MKQKTCDEEDHHTPSLEKSVRSAGARTGKESNGILSVPPQTPINNTTRKCPFVIHLAVNLVQNLSESF